MKKLFCWSGALVFLLSLLSFVWMYVIRLRPSGLDNGPAAAVANVALFTVFALHHSVMARTGAKAWITRIVPPDLERSVYVWIASLLFLAVCTLWQQTPGIIWQTLGPGLALTLRAAQIVGIWELAGVRQPNPATPIEFRADGPFAIVRHPI